MPIPQGQVLHNRYRIDAQLGQGGMGAVYRAWDLSLNIPVAVKENMDAAPGSQDQFSREAHILARISHPNLPRVIDYFFIPNQGQYLVMDYVEGENLEAMQNRLGALPEPQVLNWIAQVCEALAYLHSQPMPIIHRDIKPANIIIRPDGRAMLVDFGIAKFYDPTLATTIGAKAVTPGYSPPEQYGGGKTDSRSDIYALGATLYRLLTGQTMPESVSRAVGSSNLKPPRQINPSLSPDLEQTILKAVEIDTDRRFQKVNDFRSALTRPAPQESRPKPTPRKQPRKSALPLGLGLAGVIGICGVAVLAGVAVLYALSGNASSTPTAAAIIGSAPTRAAPSLTPSVPPPPPTIPAVIKIPTVPPLIPTVPPPPPPVLPPTPAAFHEPGLIAYYPLKDNAHDATGINGPITLENAPFQEGGVYCNGIYNGSGAPNACNILTPNLPAFNFGSFSISANFKTRDLKRMPIFVGGNTYRWIGVYIDSSGKLQLLTNNNNYKDCDWYYSINEWDTATVTYDGSIGKLYVNGALSCSVEFKLEHGGDPNVGVSNFSNGDVFTGFIRDLKIYNTVIVPGK